VSTEERSAGKTAVRVVRAEGEIDIYTADEFAAALRPTDDAFALLDLTRVPFMDSSGLRVLLVAAEAREAPIVIVLSPGSPVRRLLELSEVADRFPTFVSEEEALAAVESGSVG
jgi:anti-anti-sigma factor